jgi:hypothetical protein
MLNGTQRNTIRRALVRLGPTRVKRALGAFRDPSAQTDWCGCFLARSYGRKGKLQRLVTEEFGDDVMIWSDQYAPYLGLTAAQVYAVTEAFDGDRYDRRVLASMSRRFLSESGVSA